MIEKKIKAIFFDLDRTLWDFEKNANKTLVELYNTFEFEKLTNASPNDFVLSFRKHSKNLWQLYDKRVIDKQTLRERRFQLAMEEINIPENLRPSSMWLHFLENCPNQTNLQPGAKEILTILYEITPLYIITNGFTDVQYRKIENANLSLFFKDIIISEEVNFKKPEKEIFSLATSRAGVKNSESVMIGDSLDMDVIGALNAGLNAIWYNPEQLTNSSNHPNINQIKHLSELSILNQ